MLSLGKEDLIITPVPAGSKKGRRSVFWGTVLSVIGFMMGDGGATAKATNSANAINWQAGFSKLFLQLV